MQGKHDYKWLVRQLFFTSAGGKISCSWKLRRKWWSLLAMMLCLVSAHQLIPTLMPILWRSFCMQYSPTIRNYKWNKTPDDCHKNHVTWTIHDWHGRLVFINLEFNSLSLSHTHTLKYKQYLLLILSLEQIPQPQRNYSVSSFC